MILTDEEIYDLHDEHTWRFEGLDSKEFRFIARAIEREVLRKLRERQADAWLVGDEVFMTMEQIKTIGELAAARPLHIIPEVNE